MLRTLNFRPRPALQTRSLGTLRLGLRWAVLFSVPAVLLGLLFAMQAPPSAKAALSNTFVKCPAGEPSLNFDTIQEAVSNTSPNGVVHICTGVYSESVNLALMNGGGGSGSEGDITLVAEDGPGTVHIAPLVGSAIYISITYFAGDIVLEGLDLTSGDSAAVNLAFDPLNSVEKQVDGSVLVSGVVAHDAAGPGVFVKALEDITIVNSKAISNGSYGFDLAAVGDVTVQNSSALSNGTATIGNSSSGFLVADYLLPIMGSCPSPVPTVAFINSTANDNGGYGIDIVSFWHNVLLDTVNAHHNAYDGASVYGDGPECKVSVTVVDSAANDNGGNGVGAGRGARYVYTGSTETPSAPVNGVISPTVVLITNTSAISNGLNGFALSSGDLVTLTNVSALRNGHEGVELLFAGSVFDAATPVDVYASPQIVDQLPFGQSMSWIADSLIVDNQGYGVEYEVLSTQSTDTTQVLAPADILSATQNVNNSIICDNLRGGLAISDVMPVLSSAVVAPAAPELFNTSPLEVNATGNWWGDNSGPAHPNNPTPGNGDAIFDSSNGYTGTAYFNPWISQIRGTASPNPTLPTLPVNVAFQFSDDALKEFLGQGVGNLNDPPPFTVSTDNGLVEGSNPASPNAAASGPSIDQFVGPDDGLLPVVLTPSVAGDAAVTLEGPCSLAEQVIVRVAAPSIRVSKIPDAQTIPAGGTAAFSVTVTNSGDITLTNVTVSDPLVPNCGKAIGVLGPSESTTYSCSVDRDASFTNVATASGIPQIATNEPQPVTDTDSADVTVAPLSISLLKTVGKLGAAPSCPAAGPVTVQAGDVVEYCYTATNTGGYTLSTHSLVDSKLGLLATDVPFELGPGESVSTFDLGLVITTSLEVTTTNVATWTGSVDPAVSANSASVTASNVATVNVQETPTAIDPGDQPAFPRRIYVPSLNR